MNECTGCNHSCIVPIHILRLQNGYGVDHNNSNNDETLDFDRYLSMSACECVSFSKEKNMQNSI